MKRQFGDLYGQLEGHFLVVSHQIRMGWKYVNTLCLGLTDFLPTHVELPYAFDSVGGPPERVYLNFVDFRCPIRVIDRLLWVLVTSRGIPMRNSISPLPSILRCRIDLDVKARQCECAWLVCCR